MLVDEHKCAEWLGLSVATLRKDRREARRIPFYKIGSAVRYDLDRVREALAALEVGRPAPRPRRPAAGVAPRNPDTTPYLTDDETPVRVASGRAFGCPT